LEKKRKKLIGAKSGYSSLIFIDDVNLPKRGEFGAQPACELMRYLMQYNQFYDRVHLHRKGVDKFNIIAAAAYPGGGRETLNPRFTRLFHIFNVTEPGEETLMNIFETILRGFMIKMKFPDSVKNYSPHLAVNSTIELYHRLTKMLLPTPSKFHYTFNLRDVAKVFLGCMQVTPEEVPVPDTFNRLLLHEWSRVFGDRLTTDEDVGIF
jgi:dynein heavy chain